MKIKSLKNRIIIFLISATFSLALFLIVLKYTDSEQQKLYEAERAATSERYVRFQSAVESVINENITVLNGYMAFLSTENGVSQESAVEYLGNLIDEESSYIRNISTLEDTTILFVYPIEGNESAIGLDLSKLESQREQVLKVKESLKPVFQGPIDLIQGGTGFVARVPLLDDSGAYKGQISLVVSGDAFLDEIERLEDLHGLDTLFYFKKGSSDDSFYGDISIAESDPLSFSMSNDYVDWDVYATPKGGWTESYDSVNATLRLGGIFSVLIFLLMFYSIDVFDQSRVKLKQKNFEIKQNFFDTVFSLVHALDAKDPYTGGHSQRVMEYSVKTAQKMGLGKDLVEILSFGSILHDIGKIGIPEAILNKEGSLTDSEYKTIVRHPHIGFKIIEELELDEATKRIIHEHHERFDGRGYPNRLEGDEIHLLSRIVCIADAFDAMTSKRSYRAFPMTYEEAIEELERHRGTQFDSEILDVFIEVLHDEIESKKEDVD